MLTTKNERMGGKGSNVLFSVRFLVLLALVVMLAGCGPAGTRALLKGTKYLQEGNYADAVDELQTATEDMPTNAAAWNYLGVAQQHAGQADDAAKSYQRALELDRDLTETHYNLGCLWLEQNKLDDAISEFTAFTLRNVKSPDGWLKLGLAQLRANQVLSAEKSFSTALSIDSNNAEALNGLGLARMERGRPEEAEKFFHAAVLYHPDYAPAILNLATVEHQYLHDDQMALHEYQAYLAFQPRQANWDDVNAIVNQMEQSPQAAPAPPRPNEETQPPRQSQAYVEPRQPEYTPEESQPETERTPPSPPRQNYVPPREQTQTVRVQPETTVAPAQGYALQPVKEPDIFASSEPNPPPPAHDYNPLHWLHPESTQTVKVTPLPPANSLRTEPARPVLVQPAPPAYPSYLYLHPHAPAAGDRHSASIMFERARQFEQQGRFTDALDSYRLATREDPSWFEAQYNCAVMAYRLRDYQFALSANEMALAIRPDSVEARYNFALALKASGYVMDAVRELKKVLGSDPNNARAHLELGNIYAQDLYDVPHARQEYLKVLQLDPANPQASNIQFWLSDNPE
jgi:Flp pilus assembly protein TadD